MKKLVMAIFFVGIGAALGRAADEKFTAQFKFNDPQTLVTIDFSPKSFTLAADELDNLIAGLSRARENMYPPVPDDAPIGTRVATLVDPRWYAPPAETTPGKAVLLLKHPGYG